MPDLSGIDADFRPMIEAMLQPDPADRPASMAEIARMTRDGPLGYVGTATAAPHDDRTVWTRADQSPFGQGSAATSAPGAGARIGSTGLSQASDEPQFVPYIPPAHLSQPRPAADQPLQAAPAVKSRGRNIALAAAAMVIVGLGAGAYLRRFSDASGADLNDRQRRGGPTSDSTWRSEQESCRYLLWPTGRHKSSAASHASHGGRRASREPGSPATDG